MSLNNNLERGIKLFELKRYSEAIAYFKDSLSIDQDNLEAKYLLAQCYFLIDDFEKSKLIVKDIQSSYPNFENLYFLLSQINLHENDNELALSNINKAIEINPYNEDYFGQKSYCLINKKKFEEALILANEGLKINAKSNSCLNARAIALTKLNRKDETEETIKNLLNDDPENAYSQANVGWNLLEQNNRKKALIHFKEALKLDPNLEYAREGMLEAVKAKNYIYRLYLKYVFWIGNKSGKNQFAIIIAIYLIYRLSIKTLSSIGLSYLAIPIIIIYMLVALGSWIMEPISNSILLFDNYGKYLLSKKDKLSGEILLGLLFVSIITISLSFILNDEYLILIGLTFLAIIIPCTKAVSAFTKKSKAINLVYAISMALVAFYGYLSNSPFNTIGSIVFIMFIGYTWIGNLINR
jgi:tetratricopeptide (TPR) repeat protein